MLEQILNEIKIVKIRDVTTPSRSHKYDAGLDFYIPNHNSEDLHFPIYLTSKESILIPSGVKMELPPGYSMIFLNKSGNASKLKLDVLAQVIDSGYSGEIHLNVINNGNQSVKLYNGMKILQGIIIRIELPKVVLIKESELYANRNTNRGTKGFGSTNNS